MKLIKNGFTIAEMLICLAIIAMVIALVIPAAMSKKPNRNKAMFRKAYYNLERAVGELVNDESTFPSTKSYDFEAGKDRSTLFAYFLPEGIYKEDDDSDNIELPPLGSQERLQKYTGYYFCSQIASKLNTSGRIQCTTRHNMPDDGNAALDKSGNTSSNPNFVTNDGVTWHINPMPHFCVREVLPDGTVTYRGQDTNSTCKHQTKGDGDLKIPTLGNNNPGSDFLCFQIDVNGSDKPNCRLDYTDDNNVLHHCTDPDRFEVCVYYDGKIQVPAHSGREAEYLRSNSIID